MTIERCNLNVYNVVFGMTRSIELCNLILFGIFRAVLQ